MSGAIHSHRGVDCGLGAGSCGHYRLPLLPAVGENAAMEAKPPKSIPPKRKRRWFQYSLRSLLIFSLICAVASASVAGLLMDQQEMTLPSRSYQF